MAPIKGIKACVFDAYGTLFDVHAPVARVADRIGDKAQAMSDMWRMKQLQYTWLRSLMRTHADFEQVTADALDYAMASFGIDDATLRTDLLALYMTLDAYPDAVDTLKRLKEKGYATGILSNGSPKMLSAAVKHSGIAPLMDEVLSVEDAGIFKPDPSVYQLAVDRIGVKPGQICFVSANAWDGYAAAHFGFQVARLNRFNQPPERLPGTPKAIMKTLADLPGVLAA
ncbi:MAG: haloacid dehalogenase type II [Pseudomonadota bacterium]|nr:haloacid dehalogenase type II [Pseudomonadota bacterium]